MHIPGIQNHSAFAASSSQPTNSNTPPFAGSFLDAASSGGDAVEQFLDYAKETPAQRMFDSFLQNQHISKDQYNSMTQAEKQKLIDEFKLELKAKMNGGLGGSTASAAMPSISA
jgi:hypothetical protein